MSKGLACAIGVNKCRMYGFSISSPRETLTTETQRHRENQDPHFLHKAQEHNCAERPLRYSLQLIPFRLVLQFSVSPCLCGSDLFDLYRRCLRQGNEFDLAAAIAAAADHELQPAGAAPARLRGARQRRSLRLVADDGEPGRPPGTLPDPGYSLTLHPRQRLSDPRTREASALRRGKIIADHTLEFADGAGECVEILLRERRHRLREHQTVKMRGLGFRKLRQRLER